MGAGGYGFKGHFRVKNFGEIFLQFCEKSQNLKKLHKWHFDEAMFLGTFYG